MPKMLQVEEVSQRLTTSTVSKTNKRSKKARIYFPLEVSDHLKISANDTVAFRLVKLEGKPYVLVTKAEVKIVI